MSIRLIEQNQRGFLSVYISILTSLRYLDKQNVKIDDVKIDSSSFSLYGNPSNWFDEDLISDQGKEFGTQTTWDLSMWPTYKELDLLQYTKYIPFNSRIKNLLESDTFDYSNTLGIHYRGTDNRSNGHTQYITVDTFLESTCKEFEKNHYDAIFIATDEINVVEKFKKHFLDNYNFENIISFDHIRVDSNLGLHFNDFPDNEKIILGDQVLIDAHALSKCKTIIGKTSNVSNYARILNPTLEILYQDLNTKTINGIYSSGGNFSQIRISEIQPFIFNWRGQFEKTCNIEDSLKEIFDDVTVINSDEENTRPGWIDLGDEAYFTMQFRTALSLFKDDKKVLMHCQGDTTYDNYKKLVEDAKKHYNTYEWGVYAPDVTNVWYTPEHTDIDGIDSEDESIKMVACTDETVWFIHRDIIDEYYSRGLLDVMTHENMKMGWGWDLVMNGISFLKGRPVIRDYGHQIQHAKGTNYNKDSAAKEMEQLWSSLQNDLKECISHIKNNRENLVKYFQ